MKDGAALDSIIESIPQKPYSRSDAGVIYCADCLEIMKGIPDGAVDLVVTDPPYNVGYDYDGYNDSMPDDEYLTWQSKIIVEGERVLRHQSSFWYMHYPEYAARMFWLAPQLCDLEPFEWVNWIYHTHTGGKPLRKGSRAWCWWAKGVPFIDESFLQSEYQNVTDKRIIERRMNGLRPVGYDWWGIEQVKNVSEEKAGHPCQLPTEMLRKIVGATSRPDSIILDPFAGSGTTLVAAKQLGRRYIGIEINPDYCRIAEERLRQGELFGAA